MGTFNLAYEKEEDKSFRYLLWVQALCASKTTSLCSGPLTRNVKEQEKSAKNLLLAHLRRASKTTLATIVFAQVYEQGWEGIRKICEKSPLSASALRE